MPTSLYPQVMTNQAKSGHTEADHFSICPLSSIHTSIYSCTEPESAELVHSRQRAARAPSIPAARRSSPWPQRGPSLPGLAEGLGGRRHGGGPKAESGVLGGPTCAT
jgi:hypothetical protein